MNDLITLETELLDRLDTDGIDIDLDPDTRVHLRRFGLYDVESYPSTPDSYTVRSPNGAILLMILKTDYDAPVCGLQRYTLQVSVVLAVRNLSTYTDLYPLRDAVIARLNGYPVTCAEHSPLILRSDQALGHREGVWYRGLTFELAHLATVPNCAC